MIIIKLPITMDTTIRDLREFVRLTQGVEGESTIFSIDHAGELDGIEAEYFPKE